MLAGAVASLACVLALAACGEEEGDDGGDETPAGAGAALAEETDATLVLDFVPGAVHAGIYRAVDAGYYEDNNVSLEIIEPTSTSDTLKLIDQGKAAFGIADGIDVATQIDQGRGAKGIMALTQRPSGGLITLEEDGFLSPAELEGETVGVTGVPSDDVVLDTVVSEDGGDPQDVEKVTIGFNGVQALVGGRIAAFTGFIPADGVQLEVRGFPIRPFAFDEWGGPQYPGLVVFSTEDTISRDPELMRAFVDATVRGYEDTLGDPARSLEALLSQNPAIDREVAEAQLDAYMELFRADAPQYGVFQTRNVEELSEFLVDTDLAEGPIPTDRYATNEFVEGEGR